MPDSRAIRARPPGYSGRGRRSYCIGPAMVKQIAVFAVIKEATAPFPFPFLDIDSTTGPSSSTGSCSAVVNRSIWSSRGPGRATKTTGRTWSRSTGTSVARGSLIGWLPWQSPPHSPSGPDPMAEYVKAVGTLLLDWACAGALRQNLAFLPVVRTPGVSEGPSCPLLPQKRQRQWGSLSRASVT